ncbi:TIM barrel protein [Edaphobacter dinghuensis]|uniref:Hydroxypyruvate isomerase n=1 Tax=Edaphobacter dinghuensis TaxID=1560005 RepID=A0A917LXV2_9BACT|nr:TIM barrel protein [Edaphobacter dinghuensis]GGG64943.1 hydroxypyruvate isomerase [Edaphobacter dinghuensis]
MNRRQFSQLIAAAGVAQALPRSQAQAPASSHGFRFSVQLWTIEKQAPFDRCLEIVSAAGYEGVELIGEFRKWSVDETRRIMAKMRSLNLHFDMISGVKAGFADPNGAENFLADLKAQFEFAKALQSPQINLKSGPRIDGLSSEAQHTASVENLKRVADLAAVNNIQIVLEPIDPIENPTMYMKSVSQGFAIVRDVASPHVKVLYDFYHEQRAAGNLIEKLEQNFDLVGLVHIADVPNRNQPGTGEIDYANIYKKLAQLKYDKFIAMEFFPAGDPLTILKAARLQALHEQALVNHI